MPVAEGLGKKRARLTRGPPNIVLYIFSQAVSGRTAAASAVITTVSSRDVMLSLVVRFVSLAA